jgi:phosphatidylinositol glycan class P protein
MPLELRRRWRIAGTIRGCKRATVAQPQIRGCKRAPVPFLRVLGALFWRFAWIASSRLRAAAAVVAAGAMNTGIYGFVAWIGTHLCYAVFLLWAYLPEHVLHDLGVTYYPSKYWAVAVPCHLLVSLAAVYLLYWFYNMMRLPPLESFHNIVDEYSKDADDIPAWSQQGECIPPIYDLPIPSVNAVLYRCTPAAPLAAGHAGSSARPSAKALGTERRQASLPSHMSSFG